MAKLEEPDEIHHSLDRDLVRSEEDDLSIELIEQSERRRKRVKRVISAVLAIALLINLFSVWPTVLNWNALDFFQVSYRLYQDEKMREKKQAVVPIVGKDRKGTGFIVDPSGVVITNHHVIENQSGLYIQLFNGNTTVPTVRKTFHELDLAILDVEKTMDLPFVTPDYGYQWKEGDRVSFIGNPLGFPLIANEGIIIGTTKVKEIAEPVMMIKAPVYQGNSGSPVFNEDGHVIGVLFATVVTTIQNKEEKIGLAVPIRTIKEHIQSVTP